MWTRDLIEKVKIGLAVGAIILLLMGHVMAILKRKFKDNGAGADIWNNTIIFRIGRYSFNAIQSFIALVLLMAAAGTLNYTSYSHLGGGTHIDEYDLLHYYVAPKYFHELGYFNLVPALLIADAENGRHCARNSHTYLSQTEEGYEKKPIAHALAMTDEVKDRFTPERWKHFVHDVLYLQREIKPMGCSLWRQLIIDHGFNGTPAWVVIARPIVSIVPVEHVRLISNLDVLWLLAALLSVGWAFGLRTAGFAWVFMTICYSMRWPTVGWSMLRYDWISCIVIGLSALKKEKYITSGGFFAYAALMRYFPAIWMFAIVAKGVHALVNNKQIPTSRLWMRIPTRYYRMALGFFAVAAVLLSLSFAIDGPSTHRDSLKNMAAHVQPENLSSRRMGLALVPAYRGETDMKWISDEKRELVADTETAVRVGSLIALIFLGVFSVRLKDWEAVGLGFMPFFWLTTSSYYYYVVLLSGVIIHAKYIHQRWHLFGIFMLFFVQLYFNIAEYFSPEMRYPQISIVCILLTLYSVGIMGYLGSKWWKERHIPVEY